MAIRPTAIVAGIVGVVLKIWILFSVALFIYDTYKLKKEVKDD